MFYAELIQDCQIAERGIFLSIEEFLPYRRKGWSGTEEIDALADAVAITDDRNDAWWMRECQAFTADGMGSAAVRHMLAFHGIA